MIWIKMTYLLALHGWCLSSFNFFSFCLSLSLPLSARRDCDLIQSNIIDVVMFIWFVWFICINLWSNALYLSVILVNVLKADQGYRTCISCYYVKIWVLIKVPKKQLLLMNNRSKSIILNVLDLIHLRIVKSQITEPV